MGHYAKIRKYVVALASLACAATLAHLAFLYAYLGSVPVPQQGGTISVGIVGRAPKLSLLDPRPESSNELVLRFLFRGVMRYDPASRKVQGDVANCDLADLADVRCFMNPDAAWNDGQKITAHDVTATYDVYRSSIQNRRLAAVLAGLKVSEARDGVRFQFATADVGSLEVLFLPVLRATQVQSLTQEGFSLANLSFSGPFVLAAREYDPQYGAERIVLDRNPGYRCDEPLYVSRFVLKFFDTAADLARSRDTLHVVYAPDQGAAAPASPRLADVAFLRPQYYAFFLNAETLPLPLRRALVTGLMPKVSDRIPAKDAADVSDPFLGDFRPVAASGADLSVALATMGYFRKDEWVRRLSASGSASTGAVAPALPSVLPLAAVPSKTVRWKVPGESPSFTGASNLLLSGNVPAGTQAVAVNGYRLAKFSPGTETFWYRASVEQGTLRPGRNELKARFLGAAGEELGSETVALYYRLRAADLDADRLEWEASAGPVAAVPAIPAATGSSAATGAAPVPAAPDRLAAAKALDPRYFYGPELAPYSLDVAYLAPLSGIADALVSQLSDAGVAVNRVPLDDADLAAYVTGRGKPYGVLLAGINLGMFGYNLYPYFHSGQAESGYNFSKVRDAQLDAQLEKLRSDVRSGDALAALQGQVSKTLSDLAVFYPLHSPYLHFLVDRNLRALPQFDTLPSSAYLSDVLRGAYVREYRAPVWSGKGLSGFWDFVLSSPRP